MIVNMRSRKGFTLVELIIAVALSAVVIMAACSVLYLGADTFKSGTTNAVNQQKAALVESYLQRYASTANVVASVNDGKTAGAIFTLAGNTLTVQEQTISPAAVRTVASVDGIGKIDLSMTNGSSLNYSIHSADTTYTLEGGIVMNNYSSGTPASVLDSGKILFLEK